jgi:predicted ATPase/class 3 adenylate cyclase/Flp pilus assembly protein TadD
VQPTGTVTLLFTDVEGSTRLLGGVGPERYAEVLELHRRLLRDVFARHRGYEVDEEGDAFLVAFGRAHDAVAAAADAQRALARAAWPEGAELRVRMGVHTGEPLPAPPKYVGMDVHRAARIMAAGHGGQVLVSETTAALLDRAMPLRDLGPHRLKDLLEPVRLHQLEIEGLPGDFPALRSLRRTNLPFAAWPLLGRERELGVIRGLVAEGVRLLNLTGPGGSGKTRLALQAAAELSDEFADGVFFVGLAPLRGLSAVRSAVAEAAGLQSEDDVVGWLSSRRVLLVLDNLEHLRGVGAVVSDLLVGEVVVLTTSRAPLHLSAEQELPVDPLPNAAAVELFVSRALAAGRPAEADSTVAEVCRRLDNLPLAVELAAARSKLLSPMALLKRLDAALPLLTGGAHDLPERQRTLRATIEWSHDLLEPDAQAAFRRLSVFRRSFTLDAAEAVAGAALDQIAALLDQSLVKPLGDERFFQLETIREYARERLDEAGETDEYAMRHARHYLTRLEEIEPVLRGPRTREFLAWYSADEDNLRAMLDRLAASVFGDPARAAILLSPYWIARGTLDEGRERLKALLASSDLDEVSRPWLLERLCDFEERLGHLDAAQAAGEEAVKLATAVDARPVLVEALLGLAWIADRRDQADEAIRLASHALEQAAELDELPRLMCLNALGAALTRAGRDDEARTVNRELVEAFRRRGDTANEAIALANLGNLDLSTGDYESARSVFAQAAERGRQLDMHSVVPNATLGLGEALLGLRRRDEARAVFAAYLARAVDDRLTVDSAMKQFLGLALSGIALTSPPEALAQAARIRGAVEKLRDLGEFLYSARDQLVANRFEQPLIDALGPETWEQEKAAGAMLSLEETIALAQTLAGNALDAPSSPTAANQAILEA